MERSETRSCRAGSTLSALEAPIASSQTIYTLLSSPVGSNGVVRSASPPPPGRSRGARSSSISTAGSRSTHGGGKVWLLTRQVNVVLRHRRRRVAHQLRQRLETHPIEDGT